jgi:Glycosyltransferase family 87
LVLPTRKPVQQEAASSYWATRATIMQWKSPAAAWLRNAVFNCRGFSSAGGRSNPRPRQEPEPGMDDFRSLAEPRPWVILLAGSLMGGVLALLGGFRPEWDLLNYHLYNPHAWLHGRDAIDVAPAQLQSYLNPLFHLPHYLAFRYLSAGVLVFATGAVQGSQMLLLYLLLKLLLGGKRQPAWLLLAISLLAMGGPIFLAELGSTHGDTVLSVVVLGGLYLVLDNGQRESFNQTTLRTAASGVLLGMATALKLAFAPYAIGLGAAMLLAGHGAGRWRSCCTWAGGFGLGFLLLGGAWFAYLYARYQNPLFPYFNGFFQSPLVAADSFRDLRFMPVSLAEWLAYPFVWLIDPMRVWELPFRDLRVVALYSLLLILPIYFWRRLAAEARALRLVLVFLLLSYLLWLTVFSIYRYLAVVEMLAPLVLFAVLVRFVRSRRLQVAGMLLLLCTQWFVTFQRPAAVPELQADSPSTLQSLPADALVLINSLEPLGYVALWLDDDIPLVRTRANFMFRDDAISRFRNEAEQRVRTHRGPVFLLDAATGLSASFLSADLARMRLVLADPGACRPVFLQQDLQKKMGAVLCPLERSAAAGN